MALLAAVAGCAGPPAPPPLSLDLAKPAATYFPPDYDTSRARFRADCAAVAAAVRPGGGTRVACGSHPVRYSSPPPAAPREAAPDADLTIDTAYVSRRQPRLLILQSGLHGAEGFAGAAVQRLVSERHLARLLDAGWDVLMIHAANPWGFRHRRRIDANNVDLNRNFPTPGPRENAAYDVLRGLTELPAAPVYDVDGESFNLGFRTVLAFVRHGFSLSFVSNGTHAGQWRDPRGFEYGGRELSQQVAFWREAVAPIMATHPGPVVFLDLHTGLGPANTLTMISGSDSAVWTPDRRKALAEFARGWEGARIRVQAPDESEFQTVGDVIDFAPGLRKDGRVTALTLEWGTIGDTVPAYLATNARMILEHRARLYGCTRESVCEEVRRNLADLFNPPDDAFRGIVLAQADAVLTRIANPRVWPARQ